MISPEIEKIVELTRYAPISEEGRLKVAKQIHALYNPERKPFSEMVNNDVHFRHYYNESMIAMGEDANDKDYERFKEGFIRAKGNGVESINFVFKLADLARSMGYDMDPEKQK
ncbi:hypothetical protein [Dyadobacter sp. CY312]|uniref:hypothetical protein n=1 Tax=Dyadobacter sp. CY312 TaxID=2907303 RepID=UPI001F264D32|nr:hypothetical protein [Dyadobacter sp. CY312]MCE7039212.1 hypothetical protein [Dyadobacter sp. CY312]